MGSLITSFHFATALDVVRCALTQAFATGKLGLPVLPEVATRVIALSADPEVEIEDLCQVIEKDQPLSADVLRYANSAAFTTGEPIVSLHDAMLRMGMNMVSSIAVAACLDGREFHTPEFDAHRRLIRAHALRSASLAREIARRKRCNVDLVFMCALLHSIGRPVVLRLLTDVQKQARVRVNDADAMILTVEFEHEAAATAVKVWGLPQHVQIATAYYARPTEAPEFGCEVTVTGLASRLARWLLENTPPHEHEVRKFPEWRALQLGPGEIDEIMAFAHALRGTAVVPG